MCKKYFTVQLRIAKISKNKCTLNFRNTFNFSNKRLVNYIKFQSSKPINDDLPDIFSKKLKTLLYWLFDLN